MMPFPLTPFPWREAIGFGLGVLRLPPESFWRMTPRELALAIGALRSPVVPSLERPAFADLMARFPDASPSHHPPRFEEVS